MLPQVLEEMNSLPFEATPAVEGEVKQLDPVALDGCLSTGNGYIARIEGDRPNKETFYSFVPQRVDLKARKEDLGTTQREGEKDQNFTLPLLNI